MESEKKLPYVASVELQMILKEERYWKENAPLTIQTRGTGSSVPIAISRAVRLAFKHPNLKRKSPTYIDMSVKVTSRWLLDGVKNSKLQ